MHIPEKHKIIYFALGSLFTLSLNFSFSILHIISLTALMMLFTDTSFIDTQDLFKYYCYGLLEYFVIYNTVIYYISFRIISIPLAIILIMLMCLYILDFKIIKHAKSTYLVYFIILSLIYCKCIFTLLFFLNKLKNEYTERINKEESDERYCFIPFMLQLE